MKPKQKPKTKNLKPIPRFKSEKAERGRFVNLKPSTTAISLRLSISLLE